MVEPRAERRLPGQHRPLLVLFFQPAGPWVRPQGLQNVHCRHICRECGDATFRHRVIDHHRRGEVHRCIAGSREPQLKPSMECVCSHDLAVSAALKDHMNLSSSRLWNVCAAVLWLFPYPFSSCIACMAMHRFCTSEGQQQFNQGSLRTATLLGISDARGGLLYLALGLALRTAASASYSRLAPSSWQRDSSHSDTCVHTGTLWAE